MTEKVRMTEKVQDDRENKDFFSCQVEPDFI